jgi:hypothetical protein
LARVSGGAFVIVLSRKHKPRTRRLIPAPDPELVHRTRTIVTSVIVNPDQQLPADTEMRA